MSGVWKFLVLGALQKKVVFFGNNFLIFENSFGIYILQLINDGEYFVLIKSVLKR